MPTVKQSIWILIAIAMAFVAATTFGISAVEQTAPQVATNRFTASKADLGLKDHQRLKTLLGIERPLRERRHPPCQCSRPAHRGLAHRRSGRARSQFANGAKYQAPRVGARGSRPRVGRMDIVLATRQLTRC